MKSFQQMHYDVVVIGAGSAGVSAAISAAKNGAKTLLIEQTSVIGGDLLSGLPIDGCISSAGEWVVGGVIRELFDECDKMDGYIGGIYDWRTLWVVCIDPEIMKVVLIDAVDRHGVSVLLYSFAEDVVMSNGTIHGVVVVNKQHRTLVTAGVFIDCTGDGDIARAAGAPYELGGPEGELQPISMVFRMSNVDAHRLLTFVRDYPENVGLAENPIISKSKEECAQELYNQGYPKVFFENSGPLLREAIASGEMYPSSLLAITPISTRRKEVSVNSTRLDGIDGTEINQLSNTFPRLIQQVRKCEAFLRNRVPGFENAGLSGIAPRIGVRETRRIMGDYILTVDDVLGGQKSRDGVAKGCHELDIHGSGKNHWREQIKDGGSYDIPFGCLLPRGVSNLLVAGRCFSATREAHSSARVMGTCMAMGQAAGTAAAMSVLSKTLPRQLSISRLREQLKEQGAILEGTL